jgi:hypothetical protein
MFRIHHPQRAACALLACALLLVLALPSVTLAQPDSRAFEANGFSIDDNAIWAFFEQHGGVATFGQPISSTLTLFDQPTQVFDDAALQVQADGSVQVMPLTSQDLLPYTHFDGLTVPAADPATLYVAPTPDQPNFAARQQLYVQALVREPFLSAYNALDGSTLLGLPTSSAKPDPNNPNFVYQRFQNGILFYDGTSGTTRVLPLGEYLKAVLTGQGLPSDLSAEAASSPLLNRYAGDEAFVPEPGEL